MKTMKYPFPCPPQPIGRFDDETGLWVNTEFYRYDYGDGRILESLCGFYSDGSSIPRPLWPIIGPRYSAKNFPQAWPHDLGYAAEIMPRKELDDIFYWHSRWRQNYVLASCCWWAVDRFGGIVWNRHTPESIAAARRLVRLVDRAGNPLPLPEHKAERVSAATVRLARALNV
jgi:hypothetical protein